MEKAGFNWSAVSAAGLVCFAMQLALMLLGAGLGLSLFQVETEGGAEGIAIGGSIFAVVSVIVAFFSSGYLSAHLAKLTSKTVGGWLYGITTWAAVITFSVLFASTQTSSSLSGLLVKAGIVVSSKVGLATMIEEFKKINPRVVTDVQLLKGKAVTFIQLNPNPAGIIETTEKKLEKPSTQHEIKKEVSEAREKTGLLSLAAFGALLLSAGAAVGGGWYRDRRC